MHGWTSDSWYTNSSTSVDWVLSSSTSDLPKQAVSWITTDWKRVLPEWTTRSIRSPCSRSGVMYS